MSDKDATTSSQAASQATAVELTEFDIPGACLDAPMDRHTMSQLKWWLLCHGIKAPSSWKKQQLVARWINRISKGVQKLFTFPFSHLSTKESRKLIKTEQLPIVDVDGSYLYRKQQLLKQSGVCIAPLPPPSPPLSGWEVVSESNIGLLRFLLLPLVCTVARSPSVALYGLYCIYRNALHLLGNWCGPFWGSWSF